MKKKEDYWKTKEGYKKKRGTIKEVYRYRRRNLMNVGNDQLPYLSLIQGVPSLLKFIGNTRVHFSLFITFGDRERKERVNKI